ncbi:MAG TPA: rhodanese-like domain-containing protein [bacterium]|nr:rhodanese-like domain-containing protein [bacterium]
MGLLFNAVSSLFAGGDPSANLSPEEAQRRLSSGNPPQFVDVRSTEEHRGGRIAGSRHIALPELGHRMGELDKARPTLLYCHGGTRSGMGLRMLKAEGFQDVTHIQGGIMAWAHSGLPVERGG